MLENDGKKTWSQEDLQRDFISTSIRTRLLETNHPDLNTLNVFSKVSHIFYWINQMHFQNAYYITIHG